MEGSHASVLEVSHRDGRGRLTTWTSSAPVATPALIVPETPIHQPTHGIVLGHGDGPGDVRIQGGGTWFHPLDGLPPVAPGPTDAVQTFAVGDLGIFHDAGGWAKDPKRYVKALREAQDQLGPAKTLYAPMLGAPWDYAVHVYLGVDLFDAAPLLIAATQGIATTMDGPMQAATAGAYGCPTDTEALAAWNIQQARDELARIRLALQEGRLRALAERRAYTVPGSVELLRRADQEHEHLEATTPTQRSGLVACHTQESLWMPEVRRYRQRIREQYVPPARILVLLPCSAKKPYAQSKTHRFFQRALDDSGVRAAVHEVMVTSPLGLVPRELEMAYPAANYDVPVTGTWSRDEEAMIQKQVAALAPHYDRVVCHTDKKTFDLVQAIVPEAMHTSTGRPSGIEDCARLRDTLRSLAPPTDQIQAGRHRKAADLQALATYQFGPEAAAALCEGTHGRGRVPYTKLLAGDTQLAMLTPDRGVLSLTIDGARRIRHLEGHRVFIQDFPLKKTSSLFAVGVTHADPGVRAGDEVVVLYGDEVRGVGVAQMGAREMADATRGVAVGLRHTVKEVLA